MPRVCISSRSQSRGPAVEQAAGRSDRILVRHPPGQEEIQIFRHEQQTFGSAHLLRHGAQLINRVEGLRLGAGAAVLLLGGEDFCGRLPDAVGSAVPVGYRVADRPALPVDKDKINAPGVDPDKVGCTVQLCRPAKPLQNLPREVVQIPAEVPILLLHPVFKPIYLPELKPAALHPAQDVPAAGRADINGQKTAHNYATAFH